MGNKNVQEARRAAQDYLEGKRDPDAEAWIKNFVDMVCKEQRIEPPSVIVVDDAMLLEFTGESQAKYRHPEETLFVGADYPKLVPIARELYSHIAWKKHGDTVLKELDKCVKADIPPDQCPANVARQNWIADNVDRLYDLWFEAEHDYEAPGAGRAKKTKRI